MATLVGRFRKLFAAKKQRLPSFIEVDVDPKRHWNVLEDIGEGSFGAVKKVSKKTDPHQLAAFKCTEVQEGEDVEDLAIEVEILLACKHENVVSILAAYFYDNCLSVMLEYCEGGAVDQIMIELEKALNENQIACILRQVCTGLAFLHSKYVIHRDLKAGNLLLTGDGVVKIADFGVSCMLNGPDEGSNTFIGTPHWMSPEVIRCETMTNLLYNCKSDIWSLGITCIQLAQKEPPYHEMSAERVRLKILRSSRPPTLDHPNGFSVSFRDFIDRCLVINPDERCSATDLLTHPFVVNATDKKHITILLLEMSADFSEEPVFDNSGSCANSVCSSDSTSIWSRQDDSSNRPIMNTSMESEHSKSNSEVNTNGQPEFVDHEKTPVVQPSSALQSTKKRAAPAPPVEPKPDMKFVTVDVPPPEEEKKNPDCHMSPSGQEAMEILDDLNDVLDENYHQSPAESRPSSGASRVSSRRSTDKSPRPRLSSNPKQLRSSSESVNQNKVKFENSNVSAPEDEYTVIRCGTPTHNIKDVARMYSSDPNSFSPKSNRSRVTSTDSDISHGSKVSSPSKTNQPVTLQVNADDEEAPSSVSSKHNQSQDSTDSTKISAAAEIPSGLVKKNRELAQREQLADHAREEAERIKAQRRREDAVIFGEHHHVSELAATLSSKLTSGETNQNDLVSHSENVSKEKQVDHRPLAVKTNTSALPPRPPVSENSYTKVVSNQPFNYFVDENTKHVVEGEGPPPEPPVDYDATPKATSQVHPIEATPKSKFQRNVPISKRTNVEKENAEPKKDVLVRRTPSRQTATKKTRTFTVDGVQMTSTTTHVLEAKQNYEWRKEQEREYLRMQREEARQRNSHEKKSAALQEQQEKIFMQEKINLEKSYQSDIDMIAKTQKKKIEDIERAQEEELKQLAKKLKSDQERQIRMFKDQLTREQKMLKQEIDMLPKIQRKDAYRFRKDGLDKNQMEREMQFLEKLDREHEMFLDQLRANHRERVANTERSFLEHKHKLEQSMMSALWELEERQLSDRHTLNTQQLKELYLLQRSQMIARHQKEQEFVRRHIHEEEDRLMRDLSTNRKNLPKSLRAESKARIRMFKESLHIDFQHVPEKWDQFTQSFEENEKERVKSAIQEYELKCKKRMDALIEENQRLVKELEQIHNEKRSMLCENEQQMLAECEQQFQQLLQEARSSRPTRKAELEKRFKDEMDKQMKFYNMASTNQMV